MPEPFTPEAGEMWSKEDIDDWIDVLERVCDEAYADPDLVKSAPHHQPIPQRSTAPRWRTRPGGR